MAPSAGVRYGVDPISVVTYIAPLLLLMVIAVAIIRMRSLIIVVMLAGIFSLLMAAVFMILDAVDVAFTEAAVGAGVSTVLALGTLALTTRREKIPAHRPILPLIVVTVTGAVRHLGLARFRRPRCARPPPRRPALYRARSDRNQGAQHRHRGAGQLSRLRYAG